MFKEYPTPGVLRKPDKDDAKIWRYMDFAKFLDLIDKKRLYFTRVDKLEDPYEGSLPKRTLEFLENPSDAGALMDYVAVAKKFTVVNCWHLSDYESDAMWKLYSTNGNGMAIQSTYERLKESLEDNKNPIHIGEVDYLDYEKDRIQNHIVRRAALWKRNHFEHEKELRAVIWHRNFGKFKGRSFGDGLYVKVNLDTLIEKVYLSPTSPGWQLDLLKSVVKKYGLNKEAKRSSIYV